MRVEKSEEIVPPDQCERCFKWVHADVHHWAPKEIFGYAEADNWPTSKLCQDCHIEWHRVMNAYVRRPRNQMKTASIAADTDDFLFRGRKIMISAQVDEKINVGDGYVVTIGRHVNRAKRA
jgi:hypothetical protein